jgi:hypothetical protein
VQLSNWRVVYRWIISNLDSREVCKRGGGRVLEMIERALVFQESSIVRDRHRRDANCQMRRRISVGKSGNLGKSFNSAFMAISIKWVQPM